MPSSTSSSDFDILFRDLPAARMGLAGLLALVFCAAGILAWEKHWRDYGAEPGYYVSSDALWAIQRRRIDNGEGDKTVITGSSRILFDIQLDEWQQASGERPIQLALEGTSPISLMEDLADDADFTGTLLVGVAPGLFFSGFEYRKSAFEHYRKESPSQWTGQQLSMLIEPHFSFIHPDFALFTVLARQQHEEWLAERDAVVKYREVRKLSNIERDRNTRLWHKLENDPAYAQLAKTIWAQRFIPIAELTDEEIQQRLDGRAAQIERAVAATAKLEAKGAEVIFIRLPSQGYYAELDEPQYTPRAATWDVLIERTGALGIHWEDHPEMQGYTLPEWSHMSATDAAEFTPKLFRLIERERAARMKP